jgi:hypothetical protein
VSGGDVRQLVDIASAISADRDYDVRIEKRGSGVTVLRDGAQMATVDAPGCAGGRIGFGSRNDVARFDNLQVR